MLFNTCRQFSLQAYPDPGFARQIARNLSPWQINKAKKQIHMPNNGAAKTLSIDACLAFPVLIQHSHVCYDTYACWWSIGKLLRKPKRTD